MVPYMPGGSGNMRTDVFAPFFDLPAEYPAVSSGGFVNRENLNDLCFDFDPYGRLYATLKSPSQLYRIENLKAGGGKKVSPDINLNTFNNAAFNLRDGQLYLITSGKKIVAVPRNWVAGFWDLVGDLFSDDVSSPVFTIDEEGAFYTIPGKGEISRTKDGKTDSFDIADIIKPAGQGWDEAKVEKREILDMKALNGYLYVLLYVFLNDGERRDYDYFAAIPLEAIKTGTVKGAGWAVGGRSADQLGGGRNTGRDSTEGFFGPKKIVGWGPERIYVYDFHNDKAGFHRIVEVDLRGRRISKAGLAASGEQKR
jgi:hypothetical protein